MHHHHPFFGFVGDGFYLQNTDSSWEGGQPNFELINLNNLITSYHSENPKKFVEKNMCVPHLLKKNKKTEKYDACI